MYDDIAPVFARLSELGIGEQSGFTLLSQELRLTQGQRILLEFNRDEGRGPGRRG